MVLNIMPKNKNGQMVFVGVMTAVLVFIVLVQLITPLKTFTTNARTDLNCSSESLSTGMKGACIVVDWYMPYFLAAGIAVSVGYITQRKYVQFMQ